MNVQSHRLFAFTLLILTGCTYTVVHYDQEQLRLGMLEFYKEQVMDNLIRASNGLPFLHVDLSSLTAAVQNKLAANVGLGQTLNNTGSRVTTVGGTLAKGVASIATTASQVATRPLTVTLNPERDNNISVTENPTFGDSADVYQTYAQFLNLRKPGGPLSLRKCEWKFVDVNQQFESIKSTDLTSPPSPNQYVEGTLTRWENRYYYIPIAYKQAFFDLCFLLNARPNVITTPQTQQAALLKQSKTNTGILEQIRIQTQFNPP